ncbi:hypothetical protein G3I60_35785 [Streptomyces sp. SID13666]|uniref:ScbA/BarX family gamma-butyrolactone biosynthesis protein n=1 Tax=unclassified Streptomyces TaxID=2593676 RepID=UPI0013C1E904|nr:MULTISPECIES: ScbA/BarX family gamma-butyrolactone biosynthesis protein [unclassified Streptomyces]MCZ4102587.1 ScbA/BarX family gamma-butyrolactone biosynthesis protein [Streptomyces sp. H39-C1]NEA59382.1 hypothetical protein [Streptomyces sp. SID13666]
MSASKSQMERTAFDTWTREAATATAVIARVTGATTLTSTVPKEFVHRSAVAEVLLTDWARVDDTHFRISAQWPRGHSFFTPVAEGYHDPLIVCETIRQAGILLGHAEFGVPLGHQFIIWDLDVAVHPEHLLVGYAPAALSIDVACTEITRRGGKLSGMRITAVFHRDGNVVATGTGSFSCLAPAVYRRVRGDHTAGGDWHQLPLISPAAPQSVGRMSPMDVVLSPTAEDNYWQLRVDTRHPVLFEHPVDHIPGTVLIEAARQATAAVLRRSSYLPLSIATRFTRFVELDAPCMVEARLLDDAASPGVQTVLVTALQAGEPAFSAIVTAGSHGL